MGFNLDTRPRSGEFSDSAEAAKKGRNMKVWLKAMLPKPVLQYIRQTRERWFDIYAKRSYSQEGEDMLLDRFLEDRSVGF